MSDETILWTKTKAVKNVEQMLKAAAIGIPVKVDLENFTAVWVISEKEYDRLQQQGGKKQCQRA